MQGHQGRISQWGLYVPTQPHMWRNLSEMQEVFEDCFCEFCVTVPLCTLREAKHTDVVPKHMILCIVQFVYQRLDRALERLQEVSKLCHGIFSSQYGLLRGSL